MALRLSALYFAILSISLAAYAGSTGTGAAPALPLLPLSEPEAPTGTMFSLRERAPAEPLLPATADLSTLLEPL